MKCFSNYLNFRAKNIQRFFIQIIWIFAPKVSRYLKSLSNFLNFRAKSYFWIFAPKSIIFDFSRHKEKNWKKMKNLNFCAKIRFEKMFCLNFCAKKYFWTIWIFVPKTREIEFALNKEIGDWHKIHKIMKVWKVSRSELW